MNAVPHSTVAAEINMAPLIDVLLVLFIVYLVILSQGRQVVRIQLPAPGRARPAVLPQVIVVELPDRGGLRVNDVAVADGELETVLHEISDSRTATILLLDPGVERSYEEVIRVIDRARGVGISVIGFSSPH